MMKLEQGLVGGERGTTRAACRCIRRAYASEIPVTETDEIKIDLKSSEGSTYPPTPT